MPRLIVLSGRAQNYSRHDCRIVLVTSSTVAVGNFERTRTIQPSPVRWTSIVEAMYHSQCLSVEAGLQDSCKGWKGGPWERMIALRFRVTDDHECASASEDSADGGGSRWNYYCYHYEASLIIISKCNGRTIETGVGSMGEQCLLQWRCTVISNTGNVQTE